VSAARKLDHLRAELEKRFGNAVLPLPGTAPAPERDGFSVGVRALDQLVPEGVPRRALSLWVGEATSGRTAALRALVAGACRAGALVALVDATRTLDADAWCGGGGESAPGLWVSRAPAPEHAGEGAWVAEQLLRTGAFDLVVLDGPPPAPVDAHRLRALARATDAALLVSTDAREIGWRADLRLEFRREGAGEGGLRVGGRFRRRSGVRMAKGWGARTGERAVELVHEPRVLVRPAPFTPDRRPRARYGPLDRA
jgi:hypothetical protein